MSHSMGTFYQDTGEVAAMRVLAPVVRVEGKLAAQLIPVELCRSLDAGLETTLFVTTGRMESLKAVCQPNRLVSITQVVVADPVSRGRIEWELFRGRLCEGVGEVSSDQEGAEVIAENVCDISTRFGRRVRLALQLAGERINLERTNVTRAELESSLDENSRHDFSGQVVLPWLHPDIWPGDVVERLDGRGLELGRGRMVQEVTLRFDRYTTTLDFGGDE